MNELTTQLFEKAEVRIVEDNGEILFVGTDVCKVLGFKNPNKAMSDHCRDDLTKRYPIVDSLGRSQEVRVLAEPDVLRLIIHSKLQKAQRFEKWVFEEVLPSIRRTGSYSMTNNQPWYRLKPRFSWNDLPALKEEKRKLDRIADERDYVQAAINRVRYEEATKRLSPHDVERELFHMEQEHPYAIRKEEQHEQLPELPGGE